MMPVTPGTFGKGINRRYKRYSLISMLSASLNRWSWFRQITCPLRSSLPSTRNRTDKTTAGLHGR